MIKSLEKVLNKIFNKKSYDNIPFNNSLLTKALSDVFE